MKETKVLLITGYLGSGKTTLLNRILTNKQGIRFAVIVNDIGEVNIDADLIQKGGVVDQQDDSLVALQNGCICCSLQFDLVEQLSDIVKSGKFDYIVIEASGICEPEPIARTIASIPNMDEKYSIHGLPKLDCIATVVDALRMKSEFECGNKLDKNVLEEEDIANLVIQQIEFCNIVLLNKASEVNHEDLNRIKAIINNLQPGVEIIECDYTNIDLEKIMKELDTPIINWNELVILEDAEDESHIKFDLDEELDIHDETWLEWYKNNTNYFKSDKEDCETMLKLRKYLRDKIDDNFVLVHCHW